MTEKNKIRLVKKESRFGVVSKGYNRKRYIG